MSGLSPYTRVTLISERRRLNLVLPSSAEIGTLMPQILRMTGDSPGERVAAKVLLTDTGEALPAHATLNSVGVADGAVLRLHNHRDAPPPAVVYDVTDTVAEASRHQSALWGRRHLQIASGVVAGIAVVLGMWFLTDAYSGTHQWWILLSAGAALLLTGAVLAAVHRPVAATLQATGALTAILGLAAAAWPAPGGEPPQAPWFPVPLAALAVALLLTAALAAAAPLSARPTAILATAGVAATLTATWGAGLGLTLWAAQVNASAAATNPNAVALDPALGTAAIAGVGSVLLLGLLPSVALNASGLARLDDLRAAGSEIARGDALAAIHTAHSSLRFSAVVTAGSIGLALYLLGGGALPGLGNPVHDGGTHLVWTVPLALVLALATALRARSFPLALQRYALYLAALLGAVTVAAELVSAHAQHIWLVGLVLLLLGILAALGLTVQLAEHTQAQVRQIAARLESLAVLASVPLAVGYFGVFGMLLNSF